MASGELQGGRIVRANVDDQKLRVEAMVEKRRSESLAHEAVGAIAADDIFRGQPLGLREIGLLRLSVERRDDDARDVSRLLDRLSLFAQEQRDPATA